MTNIKIKKRHSTVTQLVRPRPTENGTFEIFVSAADDFRTYIHRDVLDFIKHQAKRAGHDEAVGLLMGRICLDPTTGLYTLVMAADGARDGECEASPRVVNLSTKGYAKVRRRLEDAHPDRELIGWYHTHPHYHARFSDLDNNEQATWSDPNNIGIVYSGIDAAEPFGVYRGPRAIRLQPFHESAV